MSLHLRNNYANILNQKRILYVPSCLIVEMMTRLYSQVSTVNLTGTMHHVVPDLLVLLRRLGANLRTTAKAYQEKRIRFFIGDWRDDKLRARKLFFNVMSRLGYISELLAPIERKIIYQAVEKLTEEWLRLDEIMESRAAERKTCTGSCDTCRYFRSEHPGNWRQIMANIILALDAENEREDDTYLILLCYKRVKMHLVKAIEESERRNSVVEKFNPDRILVVSNEDLSITCPTCTLMTDSLRKGTSEVIHRNYRGSVSADKSRISLKKSSEEKMAQLNKPQTTRRYVMPPSLASISFGSK